ncbi:hypothetical protein [Sphingobacterium corticibacter]|uniref:Potassium transporter KefB n=1 Tax=Sphingobacterium corticibacter TaxID=2171749 RepID=A0A2T8HNN3_9SPHI|nr:hypothetical protein [Sphingobacterium corticibacter]PVH27025.1 hypothetical protein DC487_05360 [Sphingobacterium corticibacter]
MTRRRVFRISSNDFKIKMMFGAALGIFVVSPFIYGNTPHNDEWGFFWFIKPLVLIPLSGAVGGALYYLSTRYLQHILPKWLLMGMGTLLLAVSIWIGAILGLNGTYWN